MKIVKVETYRFNKNKQLIQFDLSHSLKINTKQKVNSI